MLTSNAMKELLQDGSNKGRRIIMQLYDYDFENKS